VSLGDYVELDPEAIKLFAVNQRRSSRINFVTDETSGGLIAVLLEDRSIGLVMTSDRSATGSFGAVVADCTYFAPLTLNYIGG